MSTKMCAKCSRKFEAGADEDFCASCSTAVRRTAVKKPGHVAGGESAIDLVAEPFVPRKVTASESMKWALIQWMVATLVGWFIAGGGGAKGEPAVVFLGVLVALLGQLRLIWCLCLTLAQIADSVDTKRETGTCCSDKVIEGHMPDDYNEFISEVNSERTTPDRGKRLAKPPGGRPQLPRVASSVEFMKTALMMWICGGIAGGAMVWYGMEAQWPAMVLAGAVLSFASQVLLVWVFCTVIASGVDYLADLSAAKRASSHG